jgi:two-component sensor histidine kinase
MVTLTRRNEVRFVDSQDAITLARAIVDTVRDPLVVLDQDLRIIDEYEVEREFIAIGRRILLLNARKVFYVTGTHSTVLLAFEDITERRAVEQRIQDLLREKDMLLEEMQHRVANSLQIIAGILLIKARTVQSEETRLELEGARQRVLSVAGVQQHLHLSGPKRPIEIASYLSKLCETLAQSMIGDSRPISLRVEADPGTAAAHEAVSIGLIVTELVMNAVKHAFRGERQGAAIVVSYKVAATDWKLTVSDDGVGKPNVGGGGSKPGLVTSLIQALAKQPDARVQTASDSGGSAVSITHATFKAKLSAAKAAMSVPAADDLGESR